MKTPRTKRAWVLAAIALSASALVGADDEAGFESLFNGVDLSGWTSVSGGAPVGRTVEDGAIVAGKNAQPLYTVAEFENYELELAFRLPSRGNSGIGLRTPGQGDRGAGRRWNDPAFTSVEVQLLDDRTHRVGKLARCGAIYDVLEVRDLAVLKPYDQWNHMRIRLVDADVTVHVNDALVTQGNVLRSPTHQSIDKRYFSRAGAGAVRARGHIALMAATPGLAMKDLRVRRLPSVSRTLDGPDNVPPEGFVALFNGQDLTGWRGGFAAPYDNPADRDKLDPAFVTDMQARADAKLRWRVVDGVLTCEGGSRALVTEAVFRDFEMHLDYRLSPDCDAGLLLRETPQLQLWDADSAELARYGADKGSGGLWLADAELNRFPLTRADKPVGSWNHLYLRLLRNKLSVWINDELVLNGAQMDDYWGTASIVRQGGIGIVASPKKAEYKNIYLRQLQPD